jgi:hypothetical protein
MKRQLLVLITAGLVLSSCPSVIICQEQSIIKRTANATLHLAQTAGGLILSLASGLGLMLTPCIPSVIRQIKERDKQFEQFPVPPVTYLITAEALHACMLAASVSAMHHGIKNLKADFNN